MIVPSLPLRLSFPRALRQQIALTLRLQCVARVFASRCRVVVEVSPDDAYDSLGQRYADEGNFTINYFQYQDVVWCGCRVVVVLLLLVLMFLFGTV